MQSEASYREVATATASLLARLAALEHGPVIPAAANPRPVVRAGVVAERRRSLRVYFSLGFTAACIGGGIAMLVLAVVSSVDAADDGAWLIARARAAPSPIWEGGAQHEDRGLPFTDRCDVD